MCVHSWAGSLTKLVWSWCWKGVVFHYIWLKYRFGTVTIYSDILFSHFCLKIQNWVSKKKKKKKKKMTLSFQYFGSVRKGQTNTFFKPYIEVYHLRASIPTTNKKIQGLEKKCPFSRQQTQISPKVGLSSLHFFYMSLFEREEFPSTKQNFLEKNLLKF